jgi:hypothetical protein
METKWHFAGMNGDITRVYYDNKGNEKMDDQEWPECAFDGCDSLVDPESDEEYCEHCLKVVRN